MHFTISLEDLLKLLSIAGLFVGVWWNMQRQINANQQTLTKEIANLKDFLNDRFVTHDKLNDHHSSLASRVDRLEHAVEDNYRDVFKALDANRRELLANDDKVATRIQNSINELLKHIDALSNNARGSQ